MASPRVGFTAVITARRRSLGGGDAGLRRRRPPPPPGRPLSRHLAVRAAAGGIVDDEHVPEGHRGLHDELYGARGATAEHDGGEADAVDAATGASAGFRSDGDESFNVDIAFRVLRARKVAGVYAVMDAVGRTMYVGMSRNVALSLSAHRDAFGADKVSAVRIQTFAYPRREVMQRVVDEWVAALPSPPPGNSADGSDKWARTAKGALESGSDETSRAAYEEKKHKLRRAMGESVAAEDDGESAAAERDRSRMHAAVHDDDWSGVIEQQTADAAAAAASESAVRSPFESREVRSAAASVAAEQKEERDDGADGTGADLAPDAAVALCVESATDALEAVRPYLLADGGDIKVLSVDAGGDVKVLLEGACGSCPSSTTTMRMGVEKVLRERFGGAFSSVEAVSAAEDALGSALSVPLCEHVLAQVRPAITGLGGEVRTLHAADGVVRLHYTGPPKLAYGIELMLRDRFPDVVDIRFENS